MDFVKRKFYMINNLKKFNTLFFLGLIELLKKYFIIDFGVLMILLGIPIIARPELASYFIGRGIFYSAIITPLICYYEIKKGNELPFFDNIGIPVKIVFIILLFIKTIFTIASKFYV